MKRTKEETDGIMSWLVGWELAGYEIEREAHKKLTTLEQMDRWWGKLSFNKKFGIYYLEKISKDELKKKFKKH